MSDLVGTFDQWAANDGKKLIYAWLDKNNAIASSFTRQQLHQHSLNLAFVLKEKHGIVCGDRIMIVYPFGLDFIVSMLACWRIGVVVVSVYPPNPNKLAVDIEKFAHFVADCAAKVALTTSTFKRIVKISKVVHRNWPADLKWISTDSYPTSSQVPSGWNPLHKNNLTDLALIQYTSGSTGNPKGIMLSFGNLTNQISYSIRMGQNMDPECKDSFEGSVCVSWTPQYHDMGLIITYLLPLISGGISYAMSPLTFIADPPIWPKAMQKYKATFSNGPYFALALTCKRISAGNYPKFDCSSVRSIILGAEPSDISILPSVETYMGVPAASIAHSYGQAEHVVGITIGGSQTIYEDGIWAVGSIEDAVTYGKTTVRIADVIEPASNEIQIDQKFNEMAQGMEGEIWVRGPCVGMGYLNQPILSNNTFHAKLKGEPEMSYLRTGDLGFIRDGQLFITARLKDLIIIRGKNIAPSDLERAAENTFSADIRPGCSIAFQLTSETILLMCEVRQVSKDNGYLKSLADDIKLHVHGCFDLDVSTVVLLRKGSSPKTTSGKIQRSKAKKMWEQKDRALNVMWPIKGAECLMPQETDEAIPDLFSEDAGPWVAKRLADILGTKHVDMNVELYSLGLSSMGTVQLMRDMEAISLCLVESDFISESSTVNSLLVALRGLPVDNKRVVPDVILTKLRLKKSWRLKEPLKFLLQALGVVFIWTLMMVAVLPSYYFGHWFIFDLNSVPWSHFYIGNVNMFVGVLAPLLIPMWMISFSALVAIFKWIVIGKYKEEEIQMNCFAFYRWWWMDRLLNIWETFVGYFIQGTKFINVVYKGFGANVDMSVSVDSFFREFDLITLEPNAQVKGMLLARIFNAERQTIRFRKIFVGDNAKIDSESVVMAGGVISTASWLKPLSVLVEGSVTHPNTIYIQNPARKDGVTTIDRTLKSELWMVQFLMEFTVMTCIGYMTVFLSFPFVMLWESCFSNSGYSKFIFWTTVPTLTTVLAVPLAVCCKWLLLGKVKPGMHSSFSWKIREFFVNYQFRVLIYLAYRILDDYTYCSVLLLKAYGAQMATSTIFVPLRSARPAAFDLLSSGRGSFVSNATLQHATMGSHEYQEIKIENHAQVSLRAVVGAGAHIHSGSSVGPCTFLPVGQVLESGASYVSGTKLHIASNTPDTSLRSEKPFWQVCILAIVGGVFPKVVLFSVHIVCLVPSYEFANWLLFNSGIARWISIPLLSLSILMAFVTLAILGVLTTRLILGFGHSEDGYSCGMGGYTVTQMMAYGGFQDLLLPSFHGTALMRWLCRTMGAQVGENAYIASHRILEHHMLRFGNDCIVDEGAYVMAHILVNGTLRIKPVQVSDRSTLHAHSLAMCGSIAEGEVLPRTYLPERIRDVETSFI